MGYFRELPNLQYLSPLAERNSSSDYVEVKNLFKRVRMRDDLQSVFTVFDKYEIQEAERPDHVAKKLFDDSTLDWVVLITAGITNVRDQWPLSNKDLYDFVYNIYEENINSTHHYETVEVKDSMGRIILPAGHTVDQFFKSPKPSVDIEPTRSYVKYYDNNTENYVTEYNVTVPITNYEFENRKNNDKRTIYVLKRGYLQLFLNNTRTLMLYPPDSSQYINQKLIRGDNIRVTSP